MANMIILGLTVLAVCFVNARGSFTTAFNASLYVNLHKDLELAVLAVKSSAGKGILGNTQLNATEFNSSFNTIHEEPHYSFESVAENRRKLPSSFVCQSFDTFSPFSMCSDIVNYPFIVNAGSTKESLETDVRAMVPALNGMINNLCLTDYKRMICAQIYQPCIPNGKYLHIMLWFGISIHFLHQSTLMTFLESLRVWPRSYSW